MVGEVQEQGAWAWYYWTQGNSWATQVGNSSVWSHGWTPDMFALMSTEGARNTSYSCSQNRNLGWQVVDTWWSLNCILSPALSCGSTELEPFQPNDFFFQFRGNGNTFLKDKFPFCWNGCLASVEFSIPEMTCDARIHAMPCRAVPCRAKPCHAKPCHASIWTVLQLLKVGSGRSILCC